MADETIWLNVTEADTAAAMRYAIVVEWSPEDDVYVVSVPDFPEIHTHGATREEAVAMANEAIALALAAARGGGRVGRLPPSVRSTRPAPPLPSPLFAAAPDPRRRPGLEIYSRRVDGAGSPRAALS